MFKLHKVACSLIVKIMCVCLATPRCQDVFGMKAERFWRLEGGLDEWFAWAAA